MKPYYDEDGITIYHGDCRDILPQVSGDAVITDPPYGVGIEYDGYEDSPDALRALINDVFQPMRNASPLVAFTPGVKWMYEWPRPSWVLCWFEAAGSGVGPWGFTTWQPILAYGKDPHAGHGSQPDGVTFNKTRRLTEDKPIGGSHPVSKPLVVARWMVNRLTRGVSTIIDPFAGSGSFLRAARDLGHRAIGIEQSERYCEIAAERLAQGVLSFE
jgi:site-specific DNA-methyltransferase (adenine-specific)